MYNQLGQVASRLAPDAPANLKKLACATRDCSSSQVGCNGTGATPPTTLAELTVASNSGQDFYDVSNVDGFNVPMSIAPQGGNGDCKPSSCPANTIAACPEELQMKGPMEAASVARVRARLSISLSSAALGLTTHKANCPPSNYSLIFEQQCPNAHSYAYDDKNSTFTCLRSPNYAITFCP